MMVDCPDVDEYTELPPEVPPDEAVDEEVDARVQNSGEVGHVGQADHPP